MPQHRAVRYAHHRKARDPGWEAEQAVPPTVLEPGQRAAHALTQLLGRSYAEAGEIIGCPADTVLTSVARARASLCAVSVADKGTADRTGT